MKCNDFFMLYVLMFLPLTLNMCDRWRVIWSIHIPNLNMIRRSPLSYWRLTTDFSSVLGGAQILPVVILKTRGPICTKLGRDIVRSSLQTQFKMVKISCSVFKPQQLKVERWSAIRPKNAVFDPPVNITGRVGEICGSMIVAAPMSEPMV